MGNLTRVFAKVGLVVFLYYICYAFYNAYLHPIPAAGDSWDYHIPISKMILSGAFLHPTRIPTPHVYFPGSSEAINSILIFLNIPLTVSNLFAVIVLFFVCWRFAYLFGLDYYESLFFAITICTLNVIVRWYDAVSADVWVAVFFLLGIILLEKPRKTMNYFFLLGIVLGMLIGSKYSAVYYLLLLIMIYYRQISQILTLGRLIVFLIPFSVFGLFWYLRNEVLVHNPFYPLKFLSLPYALDYKIKVWHIILRDPITLFNAFFGEYKIWILALPLAIFELAKRIANKRFFPLNNITKLILFGLANLLIFLISPMDAKPTNMVSNFRYSYPLFIPLILVAFLLVKQYKKFEMLCILAISSMIMVTSLNYYPKLILFYAPASLVAIYLVDHYSKYFLKPIK